MAQLHPDGVLLLDKPAGITSTQALAKAKRILGARKAGHTGTLDPFATGLLPLVFGEATKFARFLLDATKGYRATLRLGVETTTGDTEGTELVRLPISVDEALIDEVLRRFHGIGEQIPPMHSAIRVEGRRLYQLARSGVEIERAARRIEIMELCRERYAGDELEISVTCSKGTYIRTLARDIGRALGCGAYLTGLRRTAVGGFALGQASTLEALAADAEAPARLLPVEVLVAGVPRWECADDWAWRFSQGQEIEGPDLPEGTELAVFATAGRFVGVGRMAQSRRLAPLRLMSPGAQVKRPDFA